MGAQYTTFEEFARATYSTVPIPKERVTVIGTSRSNARAKTASLPVRGIEQFTMHDMTDGIERVVHDIQSFFSGQGYQISNVEVEGSKEYPLIGDAILRMQRNGKGFRVLVSMDNGALKGTQTLRYTFGESLLQFLII